MERKISFENNKNSLKKIFKKLAFCSLAVCMGALTFLGTACSPTQNNLSSENPTYSGEIVQSVQSPLGLDPKNDPVIYTTESGLEIKYGGLDIEGTLASGALSGYPYFTMGTYGGNAVNWVIIGRATDVTQNVQIDGTESVLFSNWKSNSICRLSNYFMKNIFETTTPAGSAINSVTASKSYVVDDKIITTSLTGRVSNSEISSGCVLALSEKCLGTTKYSPITNNNYEGSGLQTYCQKLYNQTTANGGLGLTSTQKNLIKPQNLVSACAPNQTTCTSSTQYMFPLAWEYKKDNGSLWGENFMLRTYLGTYTTSSSTLWVADQAWYTRGSNGTSTNKYIIIQTSGSINSGASDNGYGVRPACVISLS